MESKHRYLFPHLMQLYASEFPETLPSIQVFCRRHANLKKVIIFTIYLWCGKALKITGYYSTNHECTQNALNRGFGKYNQTQSKYTTLYIVAGNIWYFIFLPNIISTDLSFLRLQLNRNVTATVKSIARKLLHKTLNIAWCGMTLKQGRIKFVLPIVLIS